MQATVMQAVIATLGRRVGLEEPLMTAGLDSLGASSSPTSSCQLCKRAVHPKDIRPLPTSIKGLTMQTLTEHSICRWANEGSRLWDFTT